MAHGGEGALGGIRRADVFPVFAGKVIEGQQSITVFEQLGNRLFIFHAVVFDEEVEGGVGIGLGFRLLYVVEVALGFGLDRLWHRVQDIASFVEPAPLFARRPKDLA